MLTDDLRCAWRALRARPAFTLTVVALMAFAIGANAAIFSLIDSVLLSPLPFRDPSRLVVVTGTRAGSQTEPFSIADFLDVRERTRAFEALAPAFQWSANLTGGEAERLQGMKTTSGFFSLLGVQPALGRAFLAEDDRRGGRRVALLTYGLWVRRFGGATDAVGTDIVLNGEGYTIVGVLRPDFVTPVRDAEVIVPFVVDGDPRRAVRDSRFLRVIGRLKADVGPDQAEADLARIVAALRVEYPNTNGTLTGAHVVEWHRALVAKARPALLLLQAVAGFVLLVACANLANLFLAAAIRREREFAVRAALGASRGRLARQVLLEGLLMAGAGAAAGLMMELLSRRSLLALAPADWLVAASDAAIDWRVVAFMGGVTSLAAIAFGSFPAWRVAAAAPATLLQSAGRDEGTAIGRNIRRMLVSMEVALATALVLMTVLLSQSFARLQAVDPGFRGDHLLTVRMSLPRNRYVHRADMQRFIDVLRPRLLAIPGVLDAAAVNVVPLNNYLATADVWPADRPEPPPDQLPEAHYRMITSGYFRAFGVPLIAGRVFDDRDTESSAPVVLVGRRLAERLWPDGTALGREIVMTDSPVARRAAVVGIVGNVKHFGLEAEPTADVYVPIAQVPEFTIQWLANNMYWGLRTSVEPLALADAVRRALREVDPDVPASAMRSMEQVLEAAVAPRRLNLWLVRVFAIAALVLAAAGVYAVTAFGVASRTRELAIRAALGAGHARNLGSVLQDVARPIVVGLAIGAVMMGLATPALRSALFGVENVGIGPLVAVSGGMLAVAFVAAALGAIRMRVIEPVDALRQ